MGIDIYTRWDDMTEEDRGAQITGFSVTSGHIGYLREAYHGGPYATRELLPEAFETEPEIEDDEYVRGAAIPADVLEERLPNVLKTVEERERKIYLSDDKQIAEVQKSFVDYVELIRKLEDEGRNPTIIASY